MSGNQPRLISLVVPFYNEGEGVGVFHAAIGAVLRDTPGYRFEIVCVDDGSADDTLARLVGLTEGDPRCRVIELSRNFGKEAALTAGMDAARGDAVIILDADLQDPPELIPRMIAEWEKGSEVVLARRASRAADSLLKRGTARLFYKIHNAISDVIIPPDVGDFRLMDRRVVEALKRLPERQRFMKGLFAWVGYKTSSIDYVRKPRAVGGTKLSGWKLWNFALDGITGFSIAPLRVWTYVGAAGAVLTFFYALFIVARTVLMGVDVPGYASLIVAVLFMGSLQLVSVGLLGEYIGRIYMESKNRPIYLVRREHGGGK